ncbi:CGNR zinc finger domain-containing protein [Streptomyces beijiangensis]|uniref:CGNR zinc finger domain-containing protein n=1 Tax=Streptomyces beijiangensis TaxID=163361 RepID=A0A939JDJ6_9ACTN|nr:CGNR zinc finger domain-containing protein [Streptomyces beijiangensis]MBO0510348.1 CGNR zinc finger domain-containing protein [Streptomyces beijiangensis]
MNDRAPAPGGLALIETLVNTLSIDTGDDRLAAEFSLTGAALAEAAELREALRAVCRAHAGHDVPEAGAGLTRLLSAAPLLLTFDAEGTAVLTPADPAVLSSRIAAAIATAAADGTWARLKACETEDCHWAYYDRSPAGRSRWCTMAVCGSRAKMRTYRARKARSSPRGSSSPTGNSSPSGD